MATNHDDTDEVEQAKKDLKFAEIFTEWIFEAADDFDDGCVTVTIDVPTGGKYEEVNKLGQSIVTVMVPRVSETVDRYGTEIDDGYIKIHRISLVDKGGDELMTLDDAMSYLENNAANDGVVPL
jgi:hypothetical protein